MPRIARFMAPTFSQLEDPSSNHPQPAPSPLGFLNTNHIIYRAVQADEVGYNLSRFINPKCWFKHVPAFNLIRMKSRWSSKIKNSTLHGRSAWIKMSKIGYPQQLDANLKRSEDWKPSTNNWLLLKNLKRSEEFSILKHLPTVCQNRSQQKPSFRSQQTGCDIMNMNIIMNPEMQNRSYMFIYNVQIWTIYQDVTGLWTYIWANYNISLTWIKAIWGWFQWGHGEDRY